MKLKELFIGWRSRYMRHLERHLDELRGYFATHLIEKDALIRSLRIELAQIKAENERMRLVLMPLGSPAGKLYATKYQTGQALEVQPRSQDWQGELNKMLKEEEDGIRKSGRVQEHEPGANDGA